MHVEFSYEDYLWLDIQKLLLRLEELTTDVTYRKVVYKELMQHHYMDDAVTSSKFKREDNVKTSHSQYFDFVKNTDRFVLQQVLITLKYIESAVKSKVIDSPQRFFYNTFNKVKTGEININSFHKNKQTKVSIADKKNNTVKTSAKTRVPIYANAKASTVVMKS